MFATNRLHCSLGYEPSDESGPSLVSMVYGGLFRPVRAAFRMFWHPFCHARWELGRRVKSMKGGRPHFVDKKDDEGLALDLGLTKDQSETWSQAVSRFFNSQCTRKSP